MTRASIKPMKRLLVGGVGAALLALACSGDPALFLGGPAGSTAAIQLSTNRFILQAGASATVGAQARDEVGNPTGDAVSFSACDSKVAVASGESTTQWAQVATVTGVALGESCVVASVGGMADTIRVAIGPGSMVIVGPDTVLSGEAAQYELTFLDLSGNALTPGPDFEIPEVVTLNSLRLPITAVDELNYDAAGQQPGNVTLQTTTSADFAAVTSNKIVTIVPGTFGGTVSANTGAQGTSITVSASAAVPWDADTYVTVRGAPGSNWDGTAAGTVVNPSGGSLTFLIPWSVAPGTHDLIVVNQGPGQIAQRLTGGFTVTAGTQVNNQQPFAGGGVKGTDVRARISLDRPLAFPVIWDPTTTGSVYSYYTLYNTPAASGNAGEVVVRFTVDWDDACGVTCSSGASSELFGVQIIDGAFTVFMDRDADPSSTGSTAKPQSTYFNFQENTNYLFRYRTDSGSGAAHAVIQWLGNGTLCSDNGGCVINGVR